MILRATRLVVTEKSSGRRAGGELNQRIRHMFASCVRMAIVSKRLCEVTLEVDGVRHTITVEAESVYHAAVLFYAQTAAPPPGLRLPKVTTRLWKSRPSTACAFAMP